MKAAHRVAALLVCWLTVFGSVAWAQNRVRVINNRSPIVSADLTTPVTYVDAGAELIVVREQGSWVEVVIPGLNPRRETGFVARANLVGGTPAGRAPAAPRPEAPSATAEPAPVPQQPPPTPESVRRSQAPTGTLIEPRVSLLGTGLRGFATVGGGSFLAHQSFDAVLGSSKIRGPWFGAGAQFQSGHGPYFEAGVQFFRRTGQRVFVSGDQVFTLGISDTLTLMPITATVGYRFRGRTIGPFVGGGFGQYLFSEKTPFDEAGERAWQRTNSFHGLGGVEFHAGSGVGIAVEARYARVPDALKSGVAASFNEADLGGFQVGVKVLVGR